MAAVRAPGRESVVSTCVPGVTSWRCASQVNIAQHCTSEEMHAKFIRRGGLDLLLTLATRQPPLDDTGLRYAQIICGCETLKKRKVEDADGREKGEGE